MVSEKGSLKDTPAMKLLLTIFEQGLTGILYIKRADILKVLYFNRGKMIWAISNSDVDKLGNILAAKNLVPMETINKIKKQGRVSDSIGKLLVAKGLITLEELIESSKEQLRRIIISVLKWKDGGFQFIKDAPPERLLSLDLDITQFVIDYIVEEVDISDIWKEIGSLQVEFIKNPDEQKLARYHLSDKQKELLNSFDGEKRLETILSRHSGGHRESLLKIVYFFLMAELLIKKEFDLSVLETFDVEKSIENLEDTTDEDQMVKPAEDSISLESLDLIEPGEPIEHMKPVEPAEPIKPNGDIEDFEPIVDIEDLQAIEALKPSKPTKPFEHMKPIEHIDIEPLESIEHMEPIDRVAPEPEGSTTVQDDSPVIDQESEESAEETFKDDLEDLASTTTGDDEQSVAPGVPFVEVPEEKKRLRFFNIILIMTFLILVIGGIILLLLPMMESTEPVKNIVEKESQDNTRDIIKLEEKKPPVKEDVTGSGGIPGKTETEKFKGKTGKETGPDTTSKPKKPEVTGTDQKQPTTSPIPGKTAKAYFLEGSFITAGDVWKKEIIKSGVKYGILLELDCLQESVKGAYNRLPAKKDFYILNRRIGNKTCFLVMWGKFFTHEQATEALKSTSIPTYFWQQKDPPGIIELSKYL